MTGGPGNALQVLLLARPDSAARLPGALLTLRVRRGSHRQHEHRV